MPGTVQLERQAQKQQPKVCGIPTGVGARSKSMPFSPYQPKLIHLNPLPNSGPDLPEGSLGPKFTQIYLVYT